MGRRRLLAALLLSSCAAEAPPGADASLEPAGGAWSDACHAEPVTLEELRSGLSGAGRGLAVPGLVATSQKFLLSRAKSGACLWGAFAAAEGRAGAGLLLVSFGDEHAEGGPCTPGTDGLPDELEVGDRLEAQGLFDEHAPSRCDGVVPEAQLRVDVTCPVRRTGRGASPEPLPLDRGLATRLAAGDDERLLRDYAGALVALGDVSAAQDPTDGDAVFDFGVIRLEQSALEVHSRLYYYDLRAGGPGAKGKAPRVSYPRRFRRIAGLIFLDYCRWVLAPRDRCTDLFEGSAGCPSR